MEQQAENARKLAPLLTAFFKPLITYAWPNLRHEGQPLWQNRAKALRRMRFEAKLRECIEIGRGAPRPIVGGGDPAPPLLLGGVSSPAGANANGHSDEYSDYENNLFCADLITRVSLPLIPSEEFCERCGVSGNGTGTGTGSGITPGSSSPLHISMLDLTASERRRLTDLASKSEHALSLLITLALRDPNDTWKSVTLGILGHGSWRESDDVVLKLSNFSSLCGCVYIDFTFCNFSGVPLTNTNGSIVFNGLSFFRTTFTGHIKLKNLHFSGCCLDRTNFSGCEISHSDFTASSLMSSSFRTAHGDHVKFDWANLCDANMSMFCAERPLFHYACLSGVDFSSAALSVAYMQGASLTGSVLNDSVLKDANFEDTQGLTSAQLCSCKSVQGAIVPRSLAISQDESLETLKSKLGFSFPETVRVDRSWMTNFLSNDTIGTGGSVSPLWPLGGWEKDTNWLPPSGALCSIPKSEKLHQVLVYLIHATSDTETYVSIYCELSRLKKAVERGNLLHFLQEETRQPPTHLGQSESITIYEIKVINNPKLWQQCQEKKGEIYVSLREGAKQSQISQIHWLAQLESGLPVLDQLTGECWLFHGTSQSTMKKITKDGFNCSFATPGLFSGFGALGGGGIYLSDSFPKAATYARCESCTENNCNHLKAVFICRVTLGNIYVNKKKDHKFEAGPPKGFHSSFGPNSAFDSESHFDSNEFCVPEQQVYPEFVVFYRDNQSLFNCDMTEKTSVFTHIPQPTTVSSVPDYIIQELRDYYRVLVYSDDLIRRREFLYRLQKVCDKEISGTAYPQQTQVAIHQLHQKINEEWTSLNACSLDSSPLPRYLLLKSRGDAFFFSQKWGTAIIYYKMALASNSFDRQDAEFMLNLAIARYLHSRETDAFLSLFSNAIDLDPGIVVLAHPFMSQLDYTLININALIERKGAFFNTPRWKEQILQDCCQLLCNEEIGLEEWEGYYWKLPADARCRVNEHLYDKRRFPHINNWLGSVPLNSSGNHLSSEISKVSFRTRLSELVLPLPLKMTQVTITWVNPGGANATYNLKEEYSTMLFDVNGSIQGDPSIMRLLQKSDGQPIAHIMFYPSYPLRQLAADEFTYLLSGHGTVAVLGKIVHPNRPQEPYPVFMFMPRGDSLNMIRSSDQLFASLHKKAFTWKMIETLLLQPRNDSAENLYIQEGWVLSQSTNSFMPIPLIQDGVCQLKSFIFCLPQMCDGNVKLNPHVVSAFLALDPVQLLKLWLQQIQTHDRNIKELFGAFPTLMEQYKMTSLMHFSNLPNLGKEIQYLRHLLSSPLSQNCTHGELLDFFDSGMAKCYRIATENWKCDGSIAFQKIPTIRSCIRSQQLSPFHTLYPEGDIYSFDQLGTYPIDDICSESEEAFHILGDLEKGITKSFCELNIVGKKQNLLNNAKFSHSSAKLWAPSLLQHCIAIEAQFTKLSLVNIQGEITSAIVNLLQLSRNSLLHLRLDSCHIVSFPNFSSLESLHVLRCSHLLQLTGEFPMIRVLVIKDCTAMKSLKITAASQIKCVHVIQCEALAEFKFEIKNNSAVDVQVFEIRGCNKLDLSKCVIPQFNSESLKFYQVNNTEFWKRYKLQLVGCIAQEYNQAILFQQLEYKLITPRAWKRLDEAIQKYLFVLPLILSFLNYCLDRVKRPYAQFQNTGLMFWKALMRSHSAVIPAPDLQVFVTKLRKEYKHSAFPKCLSHLLRHNQHLLTPEILQELRRLLNDANAGVRCNAASILVHNNSLSTAEIANLLHDRSAEVRSKAISCFGTMFSAPTKPIEMMGELFVRETAVTRRLCVTVIKVLEAHPGSRLTYAKSFLQKLFTETVPSRGLWITPHTTSSTETSIQWVLAELIRLCCAPDIIARIFGSLLNCLEGKDKSSQMTICKTIVVIMGKCSRNPNIKPIIPNDTIISVLGNVTRFYVGLASEIVVELDSDTVEPFRTDLVNRASNILGNAPFERLVSEDSLCEQLKLLVALDKAPSPELIYTLTRVTLQGRLLIRRYAVNLLANALHSTGQVQLFMRQNCAGRLEFGHILLISNLFREHGTFYSPSLEYEINNTATSVVRQGHEESEELLFALGTIFGASHPPNTECRAHPTRDFPFLINFCEHFSPFGPDSSSRMQNSLSCKKGWASMACRIAKSHHIFAAKYCQQLVTTYLARRNAPDNFLATITSEVVPELFRYSPEEEQQVILAMLVRLPNPPWVLLGNILRWSCHFSTASTFITAVKAIQKQCNTGDLEAMTSLGAILSIPFLDYIRPTLQPLDNEPTTPYHNSATSNCECEWCGCSFCGCHFCGSKYCS
ncbi:hypothetical protein Pelo_10683 [Pelomyxa schiedti]|nr:hypothetical protein Pelo_10683 [Pelomyxa schiedti]